MAQKELHLADQERHMMQKESHLAEKERHLAEKERYLADQERHRMERERVSHDALLRAGLPATMSSNFTFTQLPIPSYGMHPTTASDAASLYFAMLSGAPLHFVQPHSNGTGTFPSVTSRRLRAKCTFTVLVTAAELKSDSS